VDGGGLEAWAEDCWTGHVRIGQAEFVYNKPCTRCQSTRVDPDTGEQYPANQPLAELRTFRQHNKSRRALRRVVGDAPVFGMHYSLARPGVVTLGDKVWVRGGASAL